MCKRRERKCGESKYETDAITCNFIFSFKRVQTNFTKVVNLINGKYNATMILTFVAVVEIAKVIPVVAMVAEIATVMAKVLVAAISATVKALLYLP